ncbi:MAG TPA: FtsX-like permease family protein [Rhizomicrobium sp.]|nr:FtsX-like permease family protein [Rhizomicrobium sp.]
MNLLGQIFIVTALNLRNLPRRFWTSMVIVVGLAATVGVLLSMLSMTAGIRQAYTLAGSPGRAIIASLGADNEGQSSLSHENVQTIMDAPGIAKDADGRPLADQSLNMSVPLLRKNGTRGGITLRGFGPKGAKVRYEMQMVAGRMFEPGKHELIVGVGAQYLYQHVGVGDKVILPDGEWLIVGSFKSGDILEGQLIGDSDTLMTATRHPNYNTVIVRLASHDSLEELRQSLTTNPALSVHVERHSDWYTKVIDNSTGIFSTLAYAIGAIMAIGALFGCLNTMYAAVSARAREIATLRALGFNAFPVAASVILEAMLLAVIGALIGAAIAWALYDGKQDSFGTNVFRLSVPSAMVGLGILWAVILALLGGLFPAIGAARRPIAEALRAT